MHSLQLISNFEASQIFRIDRISQIFPWDPQTDSAMGHRHLVLGYAVAWTVQSAYLVYALLKQRGQRKSAAATKADRR
jgi:hypothetical protein